MNEKIKERLIKESIKDIHWLKEAKRRRKYRFFLNIKHWIEIKYLRFKRLKLWD